MLLQVVVANDANLLNHTLPKCANHDKITGSKERYDIIFYS